MCRSKLLRGAWLWPILVTGVLGCGTAPPPADDRFAALDPKNLVPVSGVVTVSGKPVPTVFITFLPPSGAGVGTAETDKDGKFVLQSIGGPGAVPGTYTVAISYMVSTNGVPQGKGARSSLVPAPELLSAKELLPAEYSDPGRSKISVTVGATPCEFNYDVPFSLPPTEKKPEVKKEKKPEEGKKPPEDHATTEKKG
jgi:hypothetical protein